MVKLEISTPSRHFHAGAIFLGLQERRVPLRQEIDGLQDRHLQLASYLHFLGQERGGLQDKPLQPATNLCFNTEITGNRHKANNWYLSSVNCSTIVMTGSKERLSPAWTEQRSPVLPTLRVREMPTTHVQRDLRQKRRRARP